MNPLADFSDRALDFTLDQKYKAQKKIYSLIKRYLKK